MYRYLYISIYIHMYVYTSKPHISDERAFIACRRATNHNCLDKLWTEFEQRR